MVVRELARESLRPLVGDVDSYPKLISFVETAVKFLTGSSGFSIQPRKRSLRRYACDVSQATLLIRYCRHLLLWNADPNGTKSDARNKAFLADDDALLEDEGGLDGTESRQRRGHLLKFLKTNQTFIIEQYFPILKSMMEDENTGE